MKKIINPLILSLLLTNILTSGNREIATGIWNGEQIDYARGEIIVGLSQFANKQDALEFLSEVNLEVISDFDWLGISLVQIPVTQQTTRNVFGIIDTLELNTNIEFAEPNIKYELFTVPDDSLFQENLQWALRNQNYPYGGTDGADINANEAWSIYTGNNNTLVAILDSGIPLDTTGQECIINGNPVCSPIPLSHPDLDDSTKYIQGRNYAGDTPWVRDGNGHGTHVTGVIAAMTNNNKGVAGVNWNCKILSIRVVNNNSDVFVNSVESAIRDAIDSSAHIINGSIGGTYMEAIERAVAAADSAGLVQIYASGSTAAGIVYPARHAYQGNLSPNGYQSILSIGATDYNDNLAGYSPYHATEMWITVVAPGGGSFYAGVLSTFPNYAFYYEDGLTRTRTYGYMRGTSAATPHVSGLASLLVGYAPNLTSHKVRKVIEYTADTLPGMNGQDSTNQYGHGRINAGTALQLIQNSPSRPTGITLVNSNGRPLISWPANPEPDVTQYKVNITYENRTGPRKFWTYAYETHYTTDTEYWDGGFFIGVGNTVAYYKISAIDVINNVSLPSYSVSTVGGVGKMLVVDIPDKFSLYSNFPNPFNPITQIMFGLPEISEVQLVVYDLLGREVVTLKSGIADPGWFIIPWEGINNSGKKVPSGIYIYTLSAQSLESKQNFVETKKMVMIK